jgi:uncharacterized protein YbgA (DUF1722 family)
VNALWDIDAGYLTPTQLNEQLQYLGEVLKETAAAGSSKLPARWRGYRDALVVRYNQLMAEQALRQSGPPTFLAHPEDALLWPVNFEESPNAQLATLRDFNTRGQRGRIGAPNSEHELWAHYKYSMLARNQEVYRHFGQLVATRAIQREELALDLVNSTRVMPTLGGLRNAVFHMWGYVSAHSAHNPNQCDLHTLMREVQQLAQAHKVTYLLNSTALGDLAYWCEFYKAQETAAAGKAKPGGGRL